MIQIFIQWTTTAKKLLLSLPKPVRIGLYKKIGNLRDSDPRKAGKPLTGPLEGLRSITHGRYRAIFSVDEEEIAGEEVRLHVRVVVEVVGIRKERDKRDVYKIATKLVELGLVPSQDEPEAHE